MATYGNELSRVVKGSVALCGSDGVWEALIRTRFNPDAAGAYQVDRLVGWRNYATTQPSNNFPDTGAQAFAANFQTDTQLRRPATAFYNYVVNNTNGFLSPNATRLRTDEQIKSLFSGSN